MFLFLYHEKGRQAGRSGFTDRIEILPQEEKKNKVLFPEKFLCWTHVENEIRRRSRNSPSLPFI